MNSKLKNTTCNLKLSGTISMINETTLTVLCNGTANSICDVII